MCSGFVNPSDPKLNASIPLVSTPDNIGLIKMRFIRGEENHCPCDEHRGNGYGAASEKNWIF
jgi:hypothetical protein